MKGCLRTMMRKMDKLVITIAHTGNVPTRELNPKAPLTTDEIIADIKKCAEAGAAVAHIHVRDEELKPTSDRALFKEVLDRLEEEKINIIKQVSTGARGGENSVAWRGQMLDLEAAEMASLSTGSSNFPTSINANSPQLINDLASKMLENNVKPEIEVFDLSMIHNAVKLQEKGIIKGPIHFNFVLNVPGALPGTPKNLMTLVDALPADATWNVSGIGRSQVQMITLAIAMGGHVRTGLEDTLRLSDGSLATNVELIEKVISIAKAVGREIATVEEAREILGLA